MKCIGYSSSVEPRESPFRAQGEANTSREADQAWTVFQKNKSNNMSVRRVHYIKFDFGV